MGFGAKPPIGSSWSEDQRDKVPQKLTTFSNFRETKLSHKFWIFRLHGERRSTSAPANSDPDSGGSPSEADDISSFQRLISEQNYHLILKNLDFYCLLLVE